MQSPRNGKKPSGVVRLTGSDLIFTLRHYRNFGRREAFHAERSDVFLQSPGARKFYEETLGFKPKEVTAGSAVYEFALGTACFLYPTPNAGTSKASQAFWQVENIEQEVVHLVGAA
jgi:hypothetical protein